MMSNYDLEHGSELTLHGKSADRTARTAAPIVEPARRSCGLSLGIEGTACITGGLVE